MKKIIFITALAFCLSFLWGETFECVYIDGDASYLHKGEWVFLDFGTELEMGSMIKLEDFSTVQFESSQSTLFFSKKGEYLLSQSMNSKGGGTQLTKISQKIGTLLSERDLQSSVAMGIRGDEAGLDDELGFGSTSAEDLDAAWDLIREENYSKAEIELESLYDMSADPFSEGDLLFALAFSEQSQGKSGEAWQHLGDIIMPELGDYYPSYLLLAGQISFMGQNFVEAASSFRTFLEINPYDEAVDEVEELLILCEKQI